jgi:transposase
LTHPFNWKKASMAAALCYGVHGGGTQLAFHVTPGSYDTDSLIEVLGELRRFLGGEKATLLWDGLPSHRSNAMRAWIRTQRSWLVVERLPAYAPELNPVEGLWSCLKAVELANLTSLTLAEVIDQAHRGIDGAPRTWPTRSCGTPASRSHNKSSRHPRPFKRVARSSARNWGEGEPLTK